MNFKVDQYLCIGCYLFAATCPEAFESEKTRVREDRSLVLLNMAGK
jgi:ferredoxin